VHVQFERRTEASAKARLLRPDWRETGFGTITPTDELALSQNFWCFILYG